MPQKIHIRLAAHRINPSIGVNRRVPKIFTPGQVITEQNEFMRGHGTYEEEGFLKSSVAGVKEQRRRSAEDEHMMRRYLQEGDLISAEVQSVYSDGSLSLHTRSLKYGKLSQGILLKVFPSLIKRSKTHFHNLYVGASIILGNNGFIWIYPTVSNAEDNAGGFVQNLEEVVSRPERETIGRLRNCILALIQSKMMLYDTSILYAFEESQKYSVAELLIPEAMVDVAILTQDRLSMLENS
ncbi:exosome complex component RRP4 isoform X2 [Tribolium madens]|uniref:exosome complex component RRP4 isoform X2 n=1 Tax=Tribolium madens TaxID=41895 RepID=UPI001CF7600E|nr:exosome complex component RRP4 isoform X2 [Tribolium madens]